MLDDPELDGGVGAPRTPRINLPVMLTRVPARAALASTIAVARNTATLLIVEISASSGSVGVAWTAVTLHWSPSGSRRTVTGPDACPSASVRTFVSPVPESVNRVSSVPATGVPSKNEASTDAVTLAPFRTAWRSAVISSRYAGLTIVATCSHSSPSRSLPTERIRR